MNKKWNPRQVLRHLVQLVAFVFFPGLFLRIFTALRDLVVTISSGSFNFSDISGSLLLLLVVFLVNILWGRLFCGYLCSFGAIQELVSWIFRSLLPRLRSVPSALDRRLKYIKYALLAIIIVAFWILQLPADASMNPWGVFGLLISGNFSVMKAAVPTLGFAALMGILAGSFFVERFFCRYLCPLGALFALSSGHGLHHIRKNKEACTCCGQCSRKCAMGIKVSDQDQVTSGECIDCMRCVEVCHPGALGTSPASPNMPMGDSVTAFLLCGLIIAGTMTSNTITLMSKEKEVLALSTTGSTNLTSPATTAKDSTSARNGLTDGVYTGKGEGLRGDVQVEITVKDGIITDINVVSFEDDDEYFSMAQSSVIPAILKQQNTDVDTVSGATFSSRGIIDAVATALDSCCSNASSAESIPSTEKKKNPDQTTGINDKTDTPSVSTESTTGQGSSKESSMKSDKHSHHEGNQGQSHGRRKRKRLRKGKQGEDH